MHIRLIASETSPFSEPVDTKNQVTLNINSFLKILKQLGEIKETQNF